MLICRRCGRGGAVCAGPGVTLAAGRRAAPCRLGEDVFETNVEVGVGRRVGSVQDLCEL